MYNPNKVYPDTHIHPSREGIKYEYKVEYTELDENIKDDYSNLKELKCYDLQNTIETAFELRMRGKFNISVYYCIEDNTSWIIEDGCYQIDQMKASEEKRKVNKLVDQITEQEEQLKELALYKEFIKKYNAEKLFTEFKEGKITA